MCVCVCERERESVCVSVMCVFDLVYCMQGKRNWVELFHTIPVVLSYNYTLHETFTSVFYISQSHDAMIHQKTSRSQIIRSNLKHSVI